MKQQMYGSLREKQLREMEKLKQLRRATQSLAYCT